MSNPAARRIGAAVAMPTPLRARLARRARVRALADRELEPAERRPPDQVSAAQLAVRIRAIEPDRAGADLESQLDALLTGSSAVDPPEWLISRLADLLEVEPAYLSDPLVADRSDTAQILEVLSGIGLQGPVRVCRSTGNPQVAEVLMEVLTVAISARARAG